jgi:cupin fold WbuC family metalloprotein
MNFPPLSNEYGVFVLDSAVVESLKLAAFQSPLRRVRICLHSSLDSPVQEMIIALCRNSVIEPHRHPVDKPESYHLIDGAMDVNIYDPLGKRLQRIQLRKDGACMYRIHGGVWHQPLAVSECAVYHEVYTGPFSKEVDVRYKDWTENEII